VAHHQGSYYITKGQQIIVILKTAPRGYYNSLNVIITRVLRNTGIEAYQHTVSGADSFSALLE
jgi:hypothetical protein